MEWGKTKLRIVRALRAAPGLRVGQLADKLGISRPAISQHLSQLGRAGIARKSWVVTPDAEHLIRQRGAD
jgi:DNA-binding transcriptional ArsR family regulator